MRKKIVAGNWKMHGSRSQVQTLLEGIKQGASHAKAELIVFPTYVHLHQAADLLKNTNLAFGAQNLYLGETGAFTGEVSAPMLVEAGCKYVLVGHSERRMIFHEDLALITAKFKVAQQFGLMPILCVGETLEQRQSNQVQAVIKQQLTAVMDEVGIAAFKNAVIAYEPVWAIGTGLTATPEQAQEMHAFIRQEISKYDQDIANHTSILYGGSVKADNAAGLFAMSDIDGGLVGGASLDAKSFLAIASV